MNRAIAGAGLGVIMACGAFGQAAATPPSFEVASIKAAAPVINGRLMIRMGGDPGRADYSNVSLRDIIRQAYGVKDYQISGPDWMNSTRFDIVAKVPDGAPKDQVPLMWQTLLAERFKLEIHRETKELPMYALVVGKNGPKMKESEIDPNALAGGGGPGSGGPGSGGPSANGGLSPLPPIRTGKDGMPQLPGGGRGPMMIMNGRGHLGAKMMNMSGLVDMLARSVDRPVVDQTGLKGNYDFNLDYTPDESTRMPMPGGVTPPPPGVGEGLHGAENPDNGLTLFAALQAQLGLKLEAKKGPVELIVIDRVEKAPTEN
jgi:uncharacterized protein (TIGR03435 family)